MRFGILVVYLAVFSGCSEASLPDLIDQDSVSNVNIEQSEATSANSGQETDGQCGNMNQLACEAFNKVNQERLAQRLSTLQVSSDCVDVAQYHAADMSQNNYFSHDGLNETWSERFARFGITGYRAENIAITSQGPERVVEMWMASQGHRDNILNSNYQYAGMGYENGYWVQCFSSNP